MDGAPQSPKFKIPKLSEKLFYEIFGTEYVK
jgi:hypothetical protein